MERILQCIIGNMDVGGLENNLMTVYRNIDRTRFQFDFITHSSHNYYGAEIVELGGRIYSVEFISKNPVKHIGHFVKFLQEHTEYKIVHIHTSYAIMYFDALLVKKYSAAKIIIHSHTSNGNGVKQKVINCLFKKKFSRLADYRVAVSSTAADWLFSNSDLKQNQCILLNNSIKTDLFFFDQNIRKQMRQKYGVQNKFVLGTVSRLDRVKNLPFAIDVLKECLINNMDCVLVMVGTGSEEAKIKEHIKNLHLEEYVIMAGETDKVNEFYNMMDCYLFPSFHEGLGLSALEAICTGVPCVINQRLPKELDVSNLIKRAPLDVCKWEKIIKGIVEKDMERQTKNFEVALCGFGVRQNVKKWEQLYEMVLSMEE